MTTAQEIRNLIEHTTTGTHRHRVPEEVKQQVRRYAERRRTQGAAWQAIAHETALEARKLLAWCQKPLLTESPPTLRPVQVVEKPKASTNLVLVASAGLRIEGLSVEEAAQLVVTTFTLGCEHAGG
jgi:hypothetical protein